MPTQSFAGSTTISSKASATLQCPILPRNVDGLVAGLENIGLGSLKVCNIFSGLNSCLYSGLKNYEWTIGIMDYLVSRLFINLQKVVKNIR